MINTLNNVDSRIGFFQQAICNCLFFHENEEGPDELVVPIDIAIEEFKLTKHKKFTLWSGELAEKLILSTQLLLTQEDHYDGLLIDIYMDYRPGYGLSLIEEDPVDVSGSFDELYKSPPTLWYSDESGGPHDETEVNRLIFIGKKGDDFVCFLLAEQDFEGKYLYKEDEIVRKFVFEGEV